MQFPFSTLFYDQIRTDYETSVIRKVIRTKKKKKMLHIITEWNIFIVE